MQMPNPSRNARENGTDVVAIWNQLRKWKVQLCRRWWLILLIVAAFIFGGAVWAYRQAPAFLSTAQMVVGGRIIMPGSTTYFEELTHFMGTQAALMKSTEVQRRTKQRVATTHPELRPVKVVVTVIPQPNTSIFNLSAVGSSGAYTQQYLGAMMTEYNSMKRGMLSEVSNDTQAAITEELKRLDTEIAQGQADLLDIQKNYNVGFLQEQGNSAAEYLVTLNRNLADLKNEYQLLESLDLDTGLDRNQKHELMSDGEEGSGGVDAGKGRTDWTGRREAGGGGDNRRGRGEGGTGDAGAHGATG